jgi:guanylate kinase
MIVLIGESASGKSFIEKQLTTIGYEKIISYTTRPKRTCETDGIDYYFITKDEFNNLQKQNFFAEQTVYNDWFYGIAKKDCCNSKVVVVEPNGMRQLQKISKLNIQSFYISVDERERAIRMIRRGDNLLEVFRRIFSDQGVFLNIKDEVKHIIDNNDFQGFEIIKNILEGENNE